MLKHKFLLFCTLVTVLLCLRSTSVIAEETVSSEQEVAREALSDVIEKAKSTYQVRAGILARRSAGERTIDETEKRLAELAKQKRALRLEISSLKKDFAGTQHQTHAAAQTEILADQLLRREEEKLLSFLRFAHIRNRPGARAPSSALSSSLLRRAFLQSLGDSVEEDLADIALARARAQLITLFMEALDSARATQEQLGDRATGIADAVEPLMTKLENMRKEYNRQLLLYEHAYMTVALSEEALQEVRDEVSGVHQQVLLMQKDLARIDAKLRRNAERELIEKGLRAPQEGVDYTASGSSLLGQQFTWPAYGKISAGYGDKRYEKYFRVPHRGIDIVIPQESPVHSAADGVVFLTRDGGAKGYSYILIGHRDGYATLYGHLSSFAVNPGQEVQIGQLIGSSGGQPGTHGAGPMTTGAHLHFEILLNGVNMNPREVLP